ncbi:hypothetical protein TNCV_4878861 [Trichonephila clavipes]|nr:hypothetical protein TNCV_4878861 [Trichonephila clavipes]
MVQYGELAQEITPVILRYLEEYIEVPFTMPKLVILSMNELNLDQAPQDINKEEFQLERVRLQAFVAATESGCTNRTH